MINEVSAKSYCCEDISHIENYDKAVADTSQLWLCHHRLEVQNGVFKTKHDLIMELKYFQRPASELIFMTKSQHSSVHSKGKKLSMETRKKIQASNVGKKMDDSKKAERRKKMIEKGTYFKRNHSTQGLHWYNNGKVQLLARSCPDGFKPGMFPYPEDAKRRMMETKRLNREKKKGGS